jgi:hypothetical protein
MKRAGCASVNVGMESGNDDILKRIKKNITASDVENAARIIKRHGLRLRVFLMIGFPWESDKQMRESVALARRARADYIIYSIVTPYPGTELFEVCTEMGLIDAGVLAGDFRELYHQSPRTCYIPGMTLADFGTIARSIERELDRYNRFHHRLWLLTHPRYVLHRVRYGKKRGKYPIHK